jgi:hypothetical protein
MFAKLSLQLLAATSIVSAFPNPLHLLSRAVIDHDAVVGFPQTVPSGLTGSLYLKYKPWLKVDNGCVPFPAVNAAGDTRCVSPLTQIILIEQRGEMWYMIRDHVLK